MIVLFLVTLLVEIIIFQLILAHSIWLNLPSQKINTGLEFIYVVCGKVSPSGSR